MTADKPDAKKVSGKRKKPETDATRKKVRVGTGGKGKTDRRRGEKQTKEQPDSRGI